MGQCFLLFLPDSHSAYNDSFVSSLPPSLGLLRICCTCEIREGWGVGGGVHPHMHTSLGKMALGVSVGFLGWALVGVARTMAVIFGTRKAR